MKKYIQSYHMFFPDKIFKVLIYLVYPLFVWGFLFIERIFMDSNFYNLLTISVVIFFIECMADFFVFAGYARKDCNRNEYLKTSVKYIDMVKKAFLSDAVRRICSILLIISVSAAILKVPYNMSIFILVSLSFFITATICILRFFDFLTIYYVISWIMTLLYVIFSVLVFFKNIFIVASIIMAILNILLILFHIIYLFKVVREEYYD